MSLLVRTHTTPTWGKQKDWPVLIASQGRETFQKTLDAATRTMKRWQEERQPLTPHRMGTVEALIVWGDDLGCVTVDLREAIEAAKQDGRWGQVARLCVACATKQRVPVGSLSKPDRSQREQPYDMFCDLCGLTQTCPPPSGQVVVHDVTPFLPAGGVAGA